MTPADTDQGGSSRRTPGCISSLLHPRPARNVAVPSGSYRISIVVSTPSSRLTSSVTATNTSAEGGAARHEGRDAPERGLLLREAAQLVATCLERGPHGVECARQISDLTHAA